MVWKPVQSTDALKYSCALKSTNILKIFNAVNIFRYIYICTLCFTFKAPMVSCISFWLDTNTGTLLGEHAPRLPGVVVHPSSRLAVSAVVRRASRSSVVVYLTVWWLTYRSGPMCQPLSGNYRGSYCIKKHLALVLAFLLTVHMWQPAAKREKVVLDFYVASY
jgi:hypothetical protein